MIFVTGGIASGKRSFAIQLGLPEEACAFDVHTLVRTSNYDEEMINRLEHMQLVTCAEVGSGIVPLDACERAYRERVGRLSCALAERADVVVRMVCGIPVVLKGDSWN